MGGKPYILAHGDFNTLYEVRTPLGQIDLLEKLGEVLRYGDGLTKTGDTKLQAIREVSEQLRSLFIPFDSIAQDAGHLEVYLNPSELALIPFELLSKENGTPLFVAEVGDRALVLTRNMRREIKKHDGNPPELPRVLFVHTKPDHRNHLKLPFPDIPFKDHEQAIRYAMRHWDPGNQLTVLPNPTFNTFKETILRAVANGRPFTHIHLLAHGSLLFDHTHPANFEYGIAFYSADSMETPYKPVSALQLRECFESLEKVPYMVTYMICDSANFTNGLKPDRNPVQATFNAGVPVVIGSQFPLSVKGSNSITKDLYKRLFRADDIRLILGDLRTKLYKEEPASSHDWISLVSYVDLPRDYEIRILMLKLKSQLQILNHVRSDFSDPFSTDAEKTEDDFIAAKVEIESSVSDLTVHFGKVEHQEAAETSFLENCSLLGSACKRLAEVEYKESLVTGTTTLEKQKEYLEASRTWYKKAADRNLSHHWSLIQYISLTTVLHGELSTAEKDYWYITKRAALTEIETYKTRGKLSLWPLGTLVELYLLTDEGITEDARKYAGLYAGQLLENAIALNDKNCLPATLFQLKRYLEWWKPPYFGIKNSLLVKDEAFVNKLLANFNSQ